jgi:hypothetical protein
MGAKKLPASALIKFRPGFQQIVMSVTQMSFDIRSGVAQKEQQAGRVIRQLFGATNACI